MTLATPCSSLPVSFRIRLSHAGGLSLQAYRWGDALPAFLLIHGLADGHHVWRHVVPSIVPYGGVIAIELRGHGDSDRDPHGVYTMDSLVSDITAALYALELESVTVIGHSLGAEVALQLTAHQTDRLRGLVLIDGGPGLSLSGIEHVRKSLASQPERYASLADYLEQQASRMPMVDPSVLLDLAPYALSAEPDGGLRPKYDEALFRDEETLPDDVRLWTLFRAIPFPFMVIRGAGSAVLPRATVARMPAENPLCSVRTVPKAGHAVMLDNPLGLISVLEPHLASLAAPVIGTTLKLPAEFSTP